MSREGFPTKRRGVEQYWEEVGLKEVFAFFKVGEIIACLCTDKNSLMETEELLIKKNARSSS